MNVEDTLIKYPVTLTDQQLIKIRTVNCFIYLLCTYLLKKYHQEKKSNKITLSSRTVFFGVLIVLLNIHYDNY